MEYAQLNVEGTEAIQVTSNGDIEWDANNFCSAKALIKDGKAAQFRVVTLVKAEAPTFDPATQSVIRDGCEFVNNQWQYKWRVDALSAEKLAENQANQSTRLLTMYTDALTRFLDLKAKEKNYDDRITCSVRAGYPGPFQAEGMAFALWMDNCNQLSYQIMEEVIAGTRPMLTSPGQLIAEMPELVWPQ